jgi:hypothetical protein
VNLGDLADCARLVAPHGAFQTKFLSFAKCKRISVLEMLKRHYLENFFDSVLFLLFVESQFVDAEALTHIRIHIDLNLPSHIPSSNSIRIAPLGQTTAQMPHPLQ